MSVLRGPFGRSSTSETNHRSWKASDNAWLPNAHLFERVVDNRVFLLGLDELYRTAVKKHERGELLVCAQHVASALSVPPADVPVEGYYTENADLSAYFRLVRALQTVPLTRQFEVESLNQFRRLLAVTSSPIFGQPIRNDYLLPQGRDSLAAALLRATSLDEWTVPLLTAAAASVARQTDDYSLVGLAARAEDPVVLTALRESAVLYAAPVVGSYRSPKFVWRVDADLSAAAQRFVDTFNSLFGRELPSPVPTNAHVFGAAFDESRIVGRCVRLGETPPPETQYYHWAVLRGADGQLVVNEFWATEIWTTSRYRATRT